MSDKDMKWLSNEMSKFSLMNGRPVSTGLPFSNVGWDDVCRVKGGMRNRKGQSVHKKFYLATDKSIMFYTVRQMWQYYVNAMNGEMGYSSFVYHWKRLNVFERMRD